MHFNAKSKGITSRRVVAKLKRANHQTSMLNTCLTSMHWFDSNQFEIELIIVDDQPKSRLGFVVHLGK